MKDLKSVCLKDTQGNKGNTYRAIRGFGPIAQKVVRRVLANVSFAVVRYLGLGND
jgi:hypothetical protein